MTPSTESTRPNLPPSSGVKVEFISIPHDNIRQQFVLDALSGAGGFDVYIADQVWLPEFYQKGFIKDLSAHVTDADRSDFIEDCGGDGYLSGHARRTAGHGP